MPLAAADAAEVMLLRTMAILEEYRRMAVEEVGEVEKLKREHAVELKKQEERWEAATKRYSDEAAKHQKINIRQAQELGKLKESLKVVTAEKEELEKEAREAELTEKAVEAEFEVTVARQAQKEAEREVVVLGEKLKKVIVDGEARVAALHAEHEKELISRAEDFEERLAEAYAEHDSEVAHLEGRLAQASRLYEAGFVLGFDQARAQVELLDPSFDTGWLDQVKIVRDGALIPDLDWGFREVEDEGDVVEVEAGGPAVGGEGRQLEVAAGGGAEMSGEGGGATLPVESSAAVEGDVPVVAEVGQLAADESCSVEEDEQAAVEGDLPVAAAESDIIDLF